MNLKSFKETLAGPKSGPRRLFARLMGDVQIRQQCKTFLNMLLEVLKEPFAGLRPDQRAYLERRQLDEITRISRLYNLSGIMTFAAANLGVLYLGHPQLKFWPAIWTAVLGAECLVWLLLDPFIKDERRKSVAMLRGVVIVLVSTLCCGMMFNSLFTIPDLSLDYFVMCGIALGVLGWGVGGGAVYYGRLVFLLSGTLSMLSLLPAVAAKATNQFGLFLVTVIPNLCAAFYFLVERRSHRNRALTEYAAAELAIQNEKLKRQAIESEVLVASKVQSAFQAPTGIKEVGTHIIEFFYVPFGLLGGDWLAERELPDGRQVIVVADVTGKGIPAAMVVQAVQSLWVASLGDPDFDPQKWMQIVNKTLYSFSRMESFTMSMGLLVLDESNRDDPRIVYYSAGHVPMFMLRNLRDHESVESIHGRGSFLGFASHIRIEPCQISLPRSEDYCLIIGTDGILDWRTRRNRRSISDLAQSAIRDGMDAVAKHPVKDDKILVTIRRDRRQLKRMVA